MPDCKTFKYGIRKHTVAPAAAVLAYKAKALKVRKGPEFAL